MELINSLLSQEAQLINQYKQEIVECFENRSLKIGQSLSRAKELCNHGEWTNWLKDNVDFTDRQARSYIQVYNKFGYMLETKRNSSSVLGIKKFNLLTQLPDNIDVDEFVEKNTVENKTVKQLAKIIKETKGVDEAERKIIEEKAKEEAREKAKEEISAFLEEKELEIDRFEKNEKLYQKELETLKDKEKFLRLELRKNKEAEKVREQLENLEAQRNSLKEEMNEIRELVRLKSNVKELIKILSPVKYSALFRRSEITQITQNTIKELIGDVISWVEDVEHALNDQSKIIEV